MNTRIRNFRWASMAVFKAMLCAIPRRRVVIDFIALAHGEPYEKTKFCSDLVTAENWWRVARRCWRRAWKGED